MDGGHLGTVDDVLHESIARAHRLLEQGANGKALAQMLSEADAELRGRLLKAGKGAGGLPAKFSGASMLAYQRQTALVLEYVQQRLGSYTHEQALKAVHAGVKDAAHVLEQLNQHYGGVARPLRLREAANMQGAVDRAFKPLMAQHAASIDRYGHAITQDVQKILRSGLLTGATNHEMIDALVAHGGPKGSVSLRARTLPSGKVVRILEEDIPEGLFKRRRYWAERLVRTEVAHAQNEARLRSIEMARQTDFPDLGKKILAVMDMRTAADSLGVHGQVRAVEDYFQDGVGRQYLRPPARPNDRESIVPWRMHWPDTGYSAPLPAEEVAEALQKPGTGANRAQQVAAAKGRLEANAARSLPAAQSAVEQAFAGAALRLSAQAGSANVASSMAAAKAKAQEAAYVAKAEATLAVGAAEREVTRALQGATMKAGKKAAAAQAKAELAQAKANAYKAKVAAAAKAAELAKVRSYLDALKTGSGTGPYEQLLALAKADPKLFGAVYSAVSGKPLGKNFFKGLGAYYKKNAVSIAKKLKLAVPVVPKASEWSKPYPEPGVGFSGFAGLELKPVDGKWLDIHAAGSGEKLGYVKTLGDKLVVDPPEWLKAKGWDKLEWPATDADAKAKSVHYALQVSKQIAAQKATEKAAPVAKHAKAKAEQAVAQAGAAREWSKRWGGWNKPTITDDPAVELERRWSNRRAGVGVAADGDMIEGFSVTVREEVIAGKSYLVSTFKLTDAGAKVARQSLGAAGAKELGEVTFVASEPGPSLTRKTSGGEKVPGVKSALRVELGETRVTYIEGVRGHVALSAMHNSVEVRVPMPKAGKRWEAVQGAVKASLGIDVSRLPSAAQQREVLRAKILTRVFERGADSIAELGVEAAWKKLAAKDSLALSMERDAQLKEVSPGFAGYYSPSLAQRFAQNGRVLIHDIKGVGTKEELRTRLTQMFVESEDPLVSSRERYTRGVFTEGMSTETDFHTGGADAVFVRVRERVGAVAHSGTFEIDPAEAGRLDWYAYNADNYGAALGATYGKRLTAEAAAASSLPASNEMMLRHSVGVEGVRRVWLWDADARQHVIGEMTRAGKHEVNGVPLEEFFVLKERF